MFVTFEGPEGAGKSTVLAAVADALRARGADVLTTREPGGGPFGPRVREILLEGDGLSPEAELFLFLADRAEHVRRVILPALAAGRWVLCDRFGDSTVAYQAYGRGLDREFVRAAHAVATGGLTPDLTLLFDLPPAVGLARLRDPDRLDREPLAFHERVRAGFLAEAREGSRWRIVDASGTPAETFARTMDPIQAFLPS